MSNVMCTRTIFFGLFYVVLLEKYVDTAFKKELQLSMSVELSAFLALMSRHTSGRSEQLREAEPCRHRGISREPDPIRCRWPRWPCLGAGAGHPAEGTPGAGKVPAGTDTPRSCSTCSSVERGPEKAARSKLSAFLQHLGDDGLVPVAQRDLVSISCSHRGNARRKARKHGEGCEETYHVVVATGSGGSSSTSSSLHGRD